MSATATITQNWQITLPEEVRTQLSLTPGVRLQFFINPQGTFTVVPITRDVRELKGIVSSLSEPVSIEEMNTAIATMGRNGL